MTPPHQSDIVSTTRPSPAVLLISFYTLLPLLSASSDDEAAALRKLSRSLKFPGWSGKDPCTWKGVGCDPISSEVDEIDLRSASVSGTLSSDINRLTNLKYLNLQNNRISGVVPFFAAMASLQELYLDGNNFTSVAGTSKFCDGLKNLRALGISRNPNLRPWSFPESLSGCSSLDKLDLSGANLAGSLPDIFSSFAGLSSLRLSYNNISGPLPPSLAGSSVQHLCLNNGDFSGGLHVISQMTDLVRVWVHVNKFTGPLPDVSKCTSLADAQFRDNQLTGVVPESLMTHRSLRSLSLVNNKLQGPYPKFTPTVKFSVGKTNSFCRPTPGPCDPQVTTLLEVVAALGYPMTLADAWKGNDPCNGWIFISCDASKKSVTAINFGKQHFTGTISPALANLTQLVTVKLNDNFISGSIPETLTTLDRLALLDVSNNNVSGRVPTFRTRVKIQTEGNAFIGQELTTPEASERPVLRIIVIVILSITGFLFLFLFVSLYVKRKKSKNEKMSELESSVIGIAKSIPIEVLTKITDGFDPDKVIGRGGFGVVYRAELPHDGTRVAIKRIHNCSNPEGREGLRQFHSEFSVLTTVRYRHLVAMLGYCISENERFVVYEYMSQGTLEQHLFEPAVRGLEPLTWAERVTIALDVARGIEYLHNYGPKNSYIHRDLKSSNILLGDGLRAKVSDFGLAKMTHDGNSSLETKLAGTFGYLAPEYAATGRVTTKVDVFAFGAVLLEMLTGRRALDTNMPDDKCHLVSCLRKYLSDKETIKAHIGNYLDPSLASLGEDSLESVYAVAELAGYCTAKDPIQRPDMGHAVTVLAPLVERWAPSETGREGEEDRSVGVGFGMSLPEALRRWQASGGGSSMYGSRFSFGSEDDRRSS